jgi:hypothetical protein
VFSSFAGRYSLFSEPREVAEVRGTFVQEPERVYELIEHTLCEGLDLHELAFPLPPLELLGDDWRDVYGPSGAPQWDVEKREPVYGVPRPSHRWALSDDPR